VNALVRDPEVKLDRRVRVVQGGLKDGEALQVLTETADVTLHVAGVVAGVKRRDFFVPNVKGTVALANAARKNGVGRFVYVSSLAAREPSINFYAESKVAAEEALSEFENDFKLTILRPSAVYGPGDTATLPLLKSLMSVTALIPGTADARFGMVHVSDVAKSLAEAVMSHRVGVSNIDDGSGGHSWPELIDITRQEFNRPARAIYIPRPVAMGLGFAGDVVAHIRGKPSLFGRGQLRQIYHRDWCVTDAMWPIHNPISLQQGLPETIRWYQEQGLLPSHRTADTRPSSQDQKP
jgi:nucleoside-diphosphate-sugar epimerase